MTRRILALDGGGVRGALSVEVLSRIEALVREETGRPDLVLADCFDLIAGTSVGAIAAALLAIGHSTAQVRRFFEDEAESLFQPARIRDRLHHRYSAERLAARLQQVFGAGTTLGSERLRTLVLLVLRNATTDSPWYLTNNPRAKFNDRSVPGCNLELPLWQIVRASAAAPVYFAPEVIDVGTERFVFSDGGLTCHNNPAFKAFLLATVEPYGLSWPTGVEQLLIVSVGTGAVDLADASLNPSAMHLLYQAHSLPRALLGAAQMEQDALCRVFGECRVGDPVDLELGDLIGARGPVAPKLFTYLRYDVRLTPAALAELGCSGYDPVALAALDGVGNVPALQAVGAALADARVKREHLAPFFTGGAAS